MTKKQTSLTVGTDKRRIDDEKEEIQINVVIEPTVKRRRSGEGQEI